MHKNIIDSIYSILVVDQRLAKYLSTEDAQVLEALALDKLVSSNDEESVSLGVNMTQLLMHHCEGLTLSDLVKYDVGARDVIQKRESIKLWETINHIGTQLQKYPE